MINGHGDDIYNYDNIRINFSSNVYCHFNHEGLFRRLAERSHRVLNYPEPSSAGLEEVLAESLGVKKSQVMATNGATEAIYLIAQTHCGSSTFIVDPTFAEYTDACLIHKHKITHIFDLPKHLFGIKLVWICCPNNPTGTVIEKEEIVRCIKNNPYSLFVIDASYAPFTYKPLITPSWAAKQSNVLMIHSMTKRFAVPGLRLGYITGNADLLKAIRQNQMPWSVNAIAQEAGIYLIHHQDEYIIDIDGLTKEKDRVSRELESTGIVEVMASDTHILLCRLRKGKASSLKDYLAINHGILIRDASNFLGLSNSHFRIAVQGHEENDELIKAIKMWKS